MEDGSVQHGATGRVGVAPPVTEPQPRAPSDGTDVATGAPPPARPLQDSTSTTIAVASKGPDPGGALLPATGSPADVTVAVGSAVLLLGVVATRWSRGRSRRRGTAEA
ncbi:MAG: hypothetical protein ACK5CE_14205 [Actinomycetes bacterium]